MTFVREVSDFNSEVVTFWLVCPAVFGRLHTLRGSLSERIRSPGARGLQAMPIALQTGVGPGSWQTKLSWEQSSNNSGSCNSEANTSAGDLFASLGRGI